LNHILDHIAIDHHGEINHRLWRAHVAEIFQWLEELRVRLIDQFSNDIKLPHVLQTEEVITEASLLEIGQLYWNLKHAAGVAERRLTLVDLCRRTRNDLAQRRPVAAHRLLQLEEEWKQIRVH